MKNLIEQVEQIKNCQLISFTYRSKSSNELARHTLRLGVDYKEVCEKDILELTLRLGETKGIEKIVIQGMIDSLKESIKAKEEGREHKDYSKKGIYRSICPGISINLNDNSLELRGFAHAKKVIEAGTFETKNYRSEETRLKDVIRKSLKIGKFRSFALDSGYAEKAKVNGQELEFA